MNTFASRMKGERAHDYGTENIASFKTYYQLSVLCTYLRKLFCIFHRHVENSAERRSTLIL